MGCSVSSDTSPIKKGKLLTSCASAYRSQCSSTFVNYHPHTHTHTNNALNNF